MRKIILFMCLCFPLSTYAIEFSFKDPEEHITKIEKYLQGDPSGFINTNSFTGSFFGLHEENQKYTFNQRINLSSVTRTSTGEIISYQNFNPIDLGFEDYTGQFNRINILLSDIRFILLILLFFYVFFESRKILKVYTYNKKSQLGKS